MFNKLVTVFVSSCPQEKFVVALAPRPHTFLAKETGPCPDAVLGNTH